MVNNWCKNVNIILEKKKCKYVKKKKVTAFDVETLT